jgi:hypothetical protein
MSAFPTEAHYYVGMPAIGSRRFDKIVVFRRPNLSSTEDENFRRYVNESLRTCLNVNGKMVFV